MRFLNNLDAVKNQLLNAKLHILPTGSLPAANTANKALIGYDSTVDMPWWVPPSGSAEYIYPARSTNTANTSVLRDGSGNFSAGTITASLTGNASTASTLQTPRNISVTGKAQTGLGGASFNGGSDIALNIIALSVSPGDITLSNGAFMVGGLFDTGAATAKSSIPISGFGAAAANVDFGSFKITNLADPTTAQDAATKAYVDAHVAGLQAKTSSRVATTANITLSGTQTIDGVALSVGDRVLVKNQTTQTENGIYVVASGSWTRSTDADSGTELEQAYSFVTEGTTQANTGWTVNVNPITLGTTNVTWIQFSAAPVVIASTGLAKTGNTLFFFSDTSTSPYTANSIFYADSGTSLAQLSAATDTVLIRGASNLTFSATLPNAVQDNITRTGTVTSGTWQSTVNLASLNSASAGVLYLAASSGTIAKLTGSAGQILKLDGSAVPTFGALDLANSASVSGILGSTNGGTGNAFFSVSGPATSAKTYTFPNQNATIAQIKRFASVTTSAGATAAYAHGFTRTDFMVQLQVTLTGEVIGGCDITIDSTNINVTPTIAMAAGEYTIIAVC